MTSPRPQRGVALIIALLVVALAAVLIAGLLDRGELNAARVRNQLREAQAQAYAQGLEAYAARVLMQAQISGVTTDSNASPWAVPLPPTKVPGGEILATMRDRNGCFNLNNLLNVTTGQPDPDWQGRFQRLLSYLRLDDNLYKAVTDWMLTAQSSEDSYYLQQDVPYRPAKRGFVHVSELRLVKGVTADVYTRLAPEVCALPRGTKINVNTASVAVLMSLSVSMNEQIAKGIWQQGHANYDELDHVPALPADLSGCLDTPASPCPVSVQSNYFLARGDITLDGLPFTFFSLIERNVGGAGANSAGIHVIERSRGADL